MAVFNSPGQAMQDPQYWDQYQPQLDAYSTWDEYQKSLADYQTWLASTPGGQPAGQAPQTFTGPGGEEWHSAGSQRMADMSQGEYSAGVLNSRLQNAGLHPDSANAKMFLQALTSRAGIRPEETQGAYMAQNPDGSQMLSPSLAAFLESLGIRPQEYVGPNQAPGAGITKDPNQVPYDPSQSRPGIPDPTRLAGPPRVGNVGGTDVSYGGVTTMPDNTRERPGALPSNIHIGGGGGDPMAWYQEMLKTGNPSTNPFGEPWLSDSQAGAKVSPQMLAFEQHLRRKYQGGGMGQAPSQPQPYGF